jgi:hypothetical protein
VPVNGAPLLHAAVTVATCAPNGELSGIEHSELSGIKILAGATVKVNVAGKAAEAVNVAYSDQLVGVQGAGDVKNVVGKAAYLWV